MNTNDGYELTATDGTPIWVWRWLPTGPVRGVIQIAHGMGEHAGRYQRVAEHLNNAGFAVYAKDHRGHGRTAQSGLLGDFGVDGWNKTLDDARLLTEQMAQRHSGKPRIILGHSMGAMLTQQYLYRYGDTIQGAVISGSPGFGPPLRAMYVAAIVQFISWQTGATGESPFLQKLLFGNSNNAFDAPDATGFEWLSRDKHEVQAYVDDPLCGFVVRPGSLVQLFAGSREAARVTNVRTIPKKLPLYLFSGSDDPVHNETRNLDRLLKRYADAGLHPTYRLYPGGRHEMFNETNGAEVLDDLTDWLNQTFPQ